MYEFEKKKLLNSINKEVLEILESEKCIIAGGCITSLFTRNEINDIDIYFRSKESLIRALKEIKSNSNIVAFTDKATMFTIGEGYAYQFIHFNFFNNAQEIFDTFDFTVCMGAYDFSTNEFIFDSNFLTHNSQRLLKINEKTAYPIVTALRVQKYISKGYTISKPEFIKIMLVINQLNINTYKELKEQMGGMYGLNYDKLFEDIQDDDKFDINIVIEKLSDLILDDDYFKLPSDNNDYYKELNKYINNYYLEGDIKIYKKHIVGDWLDNDIYIILKDRNIIKIFDENEIDIDEDKVCDDNTTMYVYKNVELREDGSLHSFYDKDFEYELLKLIKSKNPDGLFMSETLEECDTYKSSKNSVTIKCVVNLDNLIRNFQFSECIPLEIVRYNDKSE